MKVQGYAIHLMVSGSLHYARNHTMTIPGFEKEDYNCRPWDDIRVPAHIQMEGYDVPQYANVQYPWDGREEIWTDQVPEEFNPVASYVKYVDTAGRFYQEGNLYLIPGRGEWICTLGQWLNGCGLQ